MSEFLNKKVIRTWVNNNIAEHIEDGTHIVDLTGLGEDFKIEHDIDDDEAEEVDFDKILFDVVKAHPQVEDVGGDLVWTG